MTFCPSPDLVTADLDSAVRVVRSHCQSSPRVAIILGSGLGGLADRISPDAVIPYPELPGFGASTASGHRGQLILGRLDSVEVIAMAGRFHRYEGWSCQQIAFPVRLMHALGARTLIASNAAGGVNPKLRVGDIVVIRDHINWLGSPFEPADDAAVNSAAKESLRRRSDLYDARLSDLALQIAVEHRFTAYLGTYLATLGPNYETRSEYRMMRRIGADVAGMSTVTEVLAAADVKMRTLGLSMVSNVANPDRGVKADHAEVLEAGRAAETKMEAIVRGVVCQELAVEGGSAGVQPAT